MEGTTGAKGQTIRVLVVDDQAPFRHAARMVVSLTPGYELVGEAVTGEEGVELARVLVPNVVLTDVNLPGINGIAACRAIVDERPETLVVLLSTYQEEDMPGDARTCGAATYVNKEQFGPDVLEHLSHPDAA